MLLVPLTAAYAASAAWMVVLLAALRLVWLGWGGDLNGNHPHCRRCGYDLYLGSPEPACPECGAILLKATAIRRGARINSLPLTAAGVGSLAFTMLLFALTLSGAAEEMRIARIPATGAPAASPNAGTAATLPPPVQPPPICDLAFKAPLEPHGPSIAPEMDCSLVLLGQPLATSLALGARDSHWPPARFTSDWSGAAGTRPSFRAIPGD